MVIDQWLRLFLHEYLSAANLSPALASAQLTQILARVRGPDPTAGAAITTAPPGNASQAFRKAGQAHEA